jgi:hypothetical protein
MSERKLFDSEKLHVYGKYLGFCIKNKQTPSFDHFVFWCFEEGFLDESKVRSAFMEDIFCEEV